LGSKTLNIHSLLINNNSIYHLFLNTRIIILIAINYNRYINKLKNKENSKLIKENSIVFLLEYNDKAVLFTGDANIKDINEKLITFNCLSTIKLIKIPHHGTGKNNLFLCDLAKKYICREFILTVDNAWDKLHPDESVISSRNRLGTRHRRRYDDGDVLGVSRSYRN